MLEEESFAVDVVGDGETGERRIFGVILMTYIILDIMLPLKDGVSVCRDVRMAHNTTPILMLTAKGEIEDKITGLDSYC